MGWIEQIDIRRLYPHLNKVRDRLFPSAVAERISIDEYESSLEKRDHLTPAVEESLQKAGRVREQTRAIVYIAGALTGVDEKTKLRYGAVSDFLTSYGMQPDGRNLFFGYVPHLHGTDPVKHPNVTPDEVRDIDHLWATVVADSHINFTHPTAHGNAIEEGWAESHMIPTKYINQTGNRLSRLTLGMNNIANQVELYSGEAEGGIGGLKPYFDEFAAWLRRFPKKDPREFYYRSPGLLRSPALIQHGINPLGFHPVFPLQQFEGYVLDPKHPMYGKSGEVVSHDWRDGGKIDVKFPGGKIESFNDGLEKDGHSPQLSYWLK